MIIIVCQTKPMESSRVKSSVVETPGFFRVKFELRQRSNQPEGGSTILGMPCVMKEEKTTRRWTRDYWKMTLKVYKIAKKIAEDFNKEKHNSTSTCTDHIKHTGGMRGSL